MLLLWFLDSSSGTCNATFVSDYSRLSHLLACYSTGDNPWLFSLPSLVLTAPNFQSLNILGAAIWASSWSKVHTLFPDSALGFYTWYMVSVVLLLVQTPCYFWLYSCIPWPVASRLQSWYCPLAPSWPCLALTVPTPPIPDYSGDLEIVMQQSPHLLVGVRYENRGIP